MNLQLTGHFYERMLNLSEKIGDVGSWAIDKETQEVWWSNQMYEIFGVPQGQPITIEHFLSLVHPEDRKGAEAWNQELLSSTQAEDPSRFAHRIFVNGKIKWIDQKAVQYTPSDSNHRYIVGISFDFTKQKELKESYIALEQSISLEKLKTQFFTNVSHEFKTPINIILSSLQVLKLKLEALLSLPEKKQLDVLCGHMEKNSYKLLRLATNLIDSSRLKNHFLAPDIRSYNIRSLIRDVTQSAASYAGVHQIKIRFNSRLQYGELLNCDSDQVERILLNLLSNSIQNTPPGGRITVTVRDTEDFVKISVKDTGAGIAPEVIPYIFTGFKTKNSTGLTSTCTGSGLGLSIAKGLTELHNGVVSVKSKPGQGSTFAFTLSKRLPFSVPAAQEGPTMQESKKVIRITRIRMELSSLLK